MLTKNNKIEIIETAKEALKKASSINANTRQELEQEFTNILSCQQSLAQSDLTIAFNFISKEKKLNSNFKIILVGKKSSLLTTQIEKNFIAFECINEEDIFSYIQANNENIILIVDYKKLNLEYSEKIYSLLKRSSILVEYFDNEDMVDLMIGDSADHLPGWATDFSLFNIFPKYISDMFGSGYILSSDKHKINLSNTNELDNFKSSLALILLEKQGQTNQEVRITVGIRASNKFENISRLLDSIQSQTYKKLNIIISDNGTRSDLKSEIKKLFPALNIKFISGSINNAPQNRQMIMDASTTELVLICADNCYLESNCIEKLVKEISKDKDIAIISTVSPFKSSNNQITKSKLTNLNSQNIITEYSLDLNEVNKDAYLWWNNGSSILNNLHEEDNVLNSEFSGEVCLLYRKSICEILNGFPNDYSNIAFREEIDFSYRAFLAGYKVLIHTGAISYRCEGQELKIEGSNEWIKDLTYDGLKFLNKLEIWRKEKEQNNLIKSKLPIKLLTFYDEEGWAWWHRAHNLKKYLSPDIDVNILQIGQSFNHTEYDFVLLFDAYLLQSINSIPMNKLIVANSCPKIFNDTYQVLHNGLAIAAFTNNFETFKNVRYHPNFYCCQNGVDIDVFYPSSSLPSSFKACWVGNSRSMGNKGLGIIELACKKAGVELIKVDAASLSKISDAHSQEWIRDNIYHNASVYICASEFEGTPNPALESLACGLPVISTNVGNIPEIISNGVNGYIVERNADDIAQAIIKIKNSNLTTIRQEARESVSQSWSWNDKIKNYKHMIFDLKRKLEFGIEFPKEVSELEIKEKISSLSQDKEALYKLLNNNYSEISVS